MKYIFTLLLLVFSFLHLQAQQLKTVDFKTLEGSVSVFPEDQSLKGRLSYTFTIKQAVDSIFIDGKNMKVSLLKQSPLQAELQSTPTKIWLIHPFEAGQTYTVKFSYTVQHPKQSLYFVGWDNAGSNQIWSQGQGHYTSYWLPSIDDKNDKITFNLTYKVPKGYTAIGNGKLVNHHTTKTQSVWAYKMQHPMSSYLVALAVGHYQHKTLKSSHGTPLLLYYEPRFADKVEATYRYSKKIFDFLEKEIGVPYPWTTYKQVPVRDFLYAGMENTTLTIFSESFFTDSIGFIDHNYVNVNAHELAHQWFGDMITEKSSASHWLQEGFATYYALLAQQKIFGDDYFYFKLYQSAKQLKARSDKGKGQALTNPEANSLTFYQKGAWAVFILHEKLGDKAFKQGIQTFLNKYRYQNVSVKDFIRVMEESSGQDLTEFAQDWLYQSAFQAVEALEALKKSVFMQNYMQIAALRETPLSDKFEVLYHALDFPVNPYIGQEVVNQLAGVAPSPQRLKLYKKAFATNNTLVRQAIAGTLTSIPQELKSAYESLLQDPSYLTQETALFHLWKNFPENRKAYLDTLQGTQGFYNKNIRLLWLTLSIVTPDYQPSKKTLYYEELSGYTAPAYDYSIRQQALTHLYQINIFSRQSYKNLMQACTHPVWRFRKFARQLLKRLLREEPHKKKLLQLKPTLPEQQQNIISKILNTTHKSL